MFKCAPYRFLLSLGWIGGSMTRSSFVDQVLPKSRLLYESISH